MCAERKAPSPHPSPGVPGEGVRVCPECGCGDLFVRKDFPQKFGFLVVIVAAVSFLVLSAWRRTFYIGAFVLAGAVVIDALLYALVPRVTVCYRCRKEFRGAAINPRHRGFELAVAE